MAQISLDELVALSDEMAALVRAGIPLDQGLAALGDDVGGRLGRLATGWAERLRDGEDLATILAADSTDVPPMWRSVVLAGMRSGHLAAALQSLTTTIRQAVELRRGIAVSLLYPLIVVVLAFGFLVFSCLTLTPMLIRTYHDLVARPDPVIAALERIHRDLPLWAPGTAVGFCVVLWVLWYHFGWTLHSPGGSTHSGRRRSRAGGDRRWRWPSVRQALQDGRMATFAELLKLLHDQQVPLSEAVVLAADATGDRSLGQSARQVAGRLEQGAVLAHRRDWPADFPPLVGWSLVAGMGPAGMSRALATSATMYRRRAARAAQWAFLQLPVLWMATIGGSAVLLYALFIVWPLTRFLFQLSLP